MFISKLSYSHKYIIKIDILEFKSSNFTYMYNCEHVVSNSNSKSKFVSVLLNSKCIEKMNADTRNLKN